MAASADIDCLIIGAGVVGLAIARALALKGRDTLVLEANKGIGQGISSRNSEVIHAGIYYPKGSLKAQFCVAGRHALYEFCQSHKIPFQRCGKLLVAASPDQHDQILAIQAKASANGVEDLKLIDRAHLKSLEPEVEGVMALHSPSTGIIDSHAFMLALQGEAEAHGCAFAMQAPFERGRFDNGLFHLDIGGAEPMQISANHVIIAAGLSTPRLAHQLANIPLAQIPTHGFAKGNYFALARRAPFSHLIYPVPEPGGLGIHLTLDLSGRGKFGPDVEWLDVKDDRQIDYQVNPHRAEKFYAAIRKYWPGLRDGELSPDYSGVRPKIARAGEPDADFLIADERKHGIKGLIALCGIESPGLTASLAIGEHISEIINR